jgi:hypothetical protein
MASATISTTHSSNGDGIILSGHGFLTKFARFSAAFNFILSVIVLTLFFKAHLKTHGNTKTLFN